MINVIKRKMIDSLTFLQMLCCEMLNKLLIKVLNTVQIP